MSSTRNKRRFSQGSNTPEQEPITVPVPPAAPVPFQRQPTDDDKTTAVARYLANERGRSVPDRQDTRNARDIIDMLERGNLP